MEVYRSEESEERVTVLRVGAQQREKKRKDGTRVGMDVTAH